MCRALLILSVLLLIAVVYSGCGAMKPQDFAGTSPAFDFEQYFSGKTQATGILFGRNGDVKRRFSVAMEGARQGSEFILKEDFLYDDGEKQHREWRVKKLDEHTYEGTTDDVIGKATGKQFGSAMNWSYVLRVLANGRTYDLAFDDWMFLGEDGVLLNRATMSKFGVRVGELFISFKRIP